MLFVQILSTKQKDSIMKASIAEIKIAVRTIRKIKRYNVRFPIGDLIEDYEECGSLTPSQMLELFKEFEKHKIRYNPTDFRVDMSTRRMMREMSTMASEDIDLLWPAFTKKQQERYTDWISV